MKISKMTEKELEHEVEQLRQRLKELEDSRTQQDALRAVNEDLRTAEAKLRLQTDELVTSRAELRQSKQRYQELFDEAPDGYIVTDRDGYIHDVNKLAADLLGHDVESLKENRRHKVLDFLPKSAAKVALDPVLNSESRSNSGLRWEGQVFPLRGNPFWAAISVSASRDSAGSIVSLRWLIRDIGKRMRAERALRESEERLLIAKEAVGLGIHDYDIQSGRIEWDERVREIWGVDADQPVDLQIFMAGVHPDDRDSVRKAIDKALDPESGGVFLSEYRVINRKDGVERWIASTAKVFWQQGKAVRLVGALQDITEQKRSELRLKSDLRALTRMQKLSGLPLTAGGLQPLLQQIMDAAVEIMGADKGTLQLLENDSLRILAHYGHSPEFLEYFESAETRASVCGEATRVGERVIVPDIETSSLFSNTSSLKILREAGVRAVQSTPILTRAGALLGILTTQWSVPYSPSEHDFWRLDLLIRQAADLIEQNRSEAAIRESETKYRSLFQHMFEGFAYCRVLFDEHGDAVDFIYLEVNDSFGRLTGLENVVGRRVTEIIPEIGQMNPEVFEIYGRVASRGNPEQFEIYFKPLSMHLSISVYCPEKGYFVAVFDNVTERKRAEETLAASEKKFRLLSQTAEKLLKSNDPQSVVNELCREAMQFLDCQAFFNYLVDEPTNSLRLNACAGIPEHEAHKIEWLEYGVAVCGCVAQSGERMIAEDIQLSTDLRTRLVRSYGIQAYCCHPLKVGERLIGTLSFGTRTRPQFTESEVDVMRTIADQVAAAMHRIQVERSLRELNTTLEKRVEERTVDISRRAAQLRALAGELTLAEQRERRRLAKVLHDHLQQLLVGAKFRLAVLARGTDDLTKQASKEIEELLDESISSSRSLTADLSPPILHEAGLKAGLEWLARRMTDRHGLLVNLDLEDIAVLPDDLRILLFESVRELLFNITKHAHTRSSAVSMRHVDGLLQLTVSDEGVGFDPDATMGAGQPGGGFGLFSIRERLELFGGKLEIQSGPGIGSRIFLYAPMIREGVHQKLSETAVLVDSESEPILHQTPGRKIRVVLADDHVVVRQGIANLLSDEPDIEVVGMAADGREAVEVASKLLPDVILMDVSMPNLNGVEATRAIRNEYPEIRIVGLSMFEDSERAQAMRDAGAVNYITKSGPAEELLGAIRAAVHQGRSGVGSRN